MHLVHRERLQVLHAMCLGLGGLFEAAEFGGQGNKASHCWTVSILAVAP